MRTETENLMDWRQHPPLVQTQAQLGDLTERLADLDGKRSAAQERYDAAISTQTDKEARQVLNQVSDADVKAARAEADTARNELAALDAAALPTAHAKELLETEIPGLEAAAKATVRAAYHEAYKPAVKRLLDAVKAAAEANAEVEGILRKAGVDFGEDYAVEYDMHFPRFLPNLIRRDLRLTPPNHMGASELARWMDSATEYCDGGGDS